MKKAVLAVLLATASTMNVSHYAAGQAAVNLAQQGSTEITLPPAELNAWNAAQAATAPADKAKLLEAFLTQYPNTQVKGYALEALLQAYVQSDPTKVVPTADKVLQGDPTNARALTMEVFFRKQAADAITDAAQKEAALEEAAGFAQKGQAALEAKPKGMADEDYSALKGQALPLFYSTIGAAALGKKDYPAAIDAFKKELAIVPLAQTTQVGTPLGDTFSLAQAYEFSTPPDLVNCAFYAARASGFAPEPFHSPWLKTAQYCYNKFHGKLEGFEAVQQLAAANLNPPADFKIAPAPSPAEIAHEALAGGDGSTLALADREYIVANGTMTDASGMKDSDKVWAAMKGKSVTIQDALVIASTPTQLQVAVSDDAQQNKVADVTVQLTPLSPPEEPKAKTPAAQAAYKRAQAAYQKQVDAVAAATAVGNKVAFSGTYDSFTTTPSMMITMTGGEVQLPKATAAPARGGRPAAGARRGARK